MGLAQQYFYFEARSFTYSECVKLVIYKTSHCVRHVKANNTFIFAHFGSLTSILMFNIWTMTLLESEKRNVFGDECDRKSVTNDSHLPLF